MDKFDQQYAKMTDQALAPLFTENPIAESLCLVHCLRKQNKGQSLIKGRDKQALIEMTASRILKSASALKALQNSGVSILA